MKLQNLPTYFRKIWWLGATQLLLRSEKVKHGSRVSFYGVPIISRHKDSSITISDRVTLCSDSRFTALGVSRPVILRTLQAGASISIGEDSGLSGTTICAASSVTIGARCLIGADVMITDTDFHPLQPEGRRYAGPSEARSRAVVIEDDVFIGARSVVLPGVRIGKGAVVGAGSVVTKDIPSNAVSAGNAARFIRQLDTKEQ